MRSTWTAIVAVVALAAAGCTTLVQVSAPEGPQVGGHSWPQFGQGGPVVSGDARWSVYVAPRSTTSNISEVYRRDNANGTTTRISHSADHHPVGGTMPAISRDGRYVLFKTAAALVSSDTNLDPAHALTGEDWYVADTTTGSFDLVSIDDAGHQVRPGGPDHFVDTAFVDASGRYVAFEMDHFTSTTPDNRVYLRDRMTGVTHLVGHGFVEVAGLSGDGLHVGIDDFQGCTPGSPCTPAIGVHVVDWQAGGTYHIGCGASGPTPMSDQGLYVAVAQSNVTGCERGVARYNRLATGPPTMFARVAPVVGSTALFFSRVVMSPDALTAAFTTDVALDPADTNGLEDVYVSDLGQGWFGAASRTAFGVFADGGSQLPSLSADGRYVQFDTQATNLVPGGASQTVLTPAARPDEVQVVPRRSDPPKVAPGGSVTFFLGGRNIAADAIPIVSGSGVSVRREAGSGVDFLNLTITVAPDAAPGLRSITVVNPGRYGVASGTCVGCLDVGAPPG
jgi:hypothetical protein